MAKKKAEIEEKAEAKVKQSKEKKAVETEKVETKPVKKAAEKVVKPDSPAKEDKKEEILVAKSPKKASTKVVAKVEEKVETVQQKEVIVEKPKIEPANLAKKEVEKNSPVLNPNVRYSDEELEEFSTLITQEKETALDELRMLKERLDDLTSFDAADESMIYSMHMAEQGSEAQEKEKTYAQIQRIHEYIKKLEEAMERIKNKTYGICRVCGCLIAKERLRAVPITTLSASYKIHQRCPEDGVDRIEPVKK